MNCDKGQLKHYIGFYKGGHTYITHLNTSKINPLQQDSQSTVAEECQ